MPVTGNIDGLVSRVMEKLERISSRLGKDVFVTSGKRTGPIDDSAHNSGIAADARVDGLNSIEFTNKLVDEGFTGVGEYYDTDGAPERFAYGDIRGLPGSESSGAYTPGGRKSQPLCWFRLGEEYTWGRRRSGERCPRRDRRQLTLAVVGSSQDEQEHLTEPLGTWLAGRGLNLLTGGGGGVMTSVAKHFVNARGASDRGIVLGIIPNSLGKGAVATPANYDPKARYPNEFVEVAVFTHLPSGAYDTSRNHINVLSADVVVALRGGIGTKHEVKLARDYGKPVVDFHDLESFARVKQEVVKAFL